MLKSLTIIVAGKFADRSTVRYPSPDMNLTAIRSADRAKLRCLATLAASIIFTTCKTPPLPAVAPLADAGLDRVVAVGAHVTLDGTGSRAAPGGDAAGLRFAWVAITSPTGSPVVLSYQESATPQFLVDTEGDYVFELVVTDGGLSSRPDVVIIRGFDALKIVRQTPPDGAFGVAPNAPVVIAFSAPVQPDTVSPTSFFVRYSTGGQPATVPGFIEVQQAGMLAVFSPTTPFPQGQGVTVVVTERVTALSGLTLPASYQGRFMIAPGPDTQAPSVVEVIPADGAANVARSASIIVVFDEPIAAASLSADSNSDGCKDNLELTDSSSVCVPTTLTQRAGGTRVLLVPTSPLTAGGGYTLAVKAAVADLAGNPLIAASLTSFTVTSAPDTTPPTVVGVYPGRGYTDAPLGADITVTFSEPVQPSTVTTASLQLLKSGAPNPVDGAVSVSADSLTATFAPEGLLAAGFTYTIIVHGSGANVVTDMSGMALDGNSDNLPGGDFQSEFGTTTTPTRDGRLTVPGTIVPGETFTVSLSDSDMDKTVARDTVRIAARSSTGEIEQLLDLKETLGRSGVFSLPVPTTLAPGAGTDNDGTFNVQVGTSIELTYLDQASAAGIQEYVRATTTVVLGLAGIYVSALTTPNTTEGGGTTAFFVKLNTLPTASVTVHFNSNNLAEGTVSVTSLVFTTANWSTLQQVTITGVDDAIDDGDVAYAIVFTPSTSADPVYNGLTPGSLALFNIDNDGTGVTLGSYSGSTTETGGTYPFTVVLNSQPAADVTVSFHSDTPSEGIVSPTSLTFTPGNWSTTQTVTVTGVDDFVDDGDQSYQIVFDPTTSGDATYDGLSIASVAMTNVDNDSVGFEVFPSGVTTTEAGGTVNFTVRLTSQPTANVTLHLDSSDSTEGTVSATALTFTTGNWNTTQTVTVTGVNDILQDGNQEYSVTFAATTSADPLYAAIKPVDLVLTNREVGTDGAPAIVESTFVLGRSIRVRVTGDTDEYANLLAGAGNDAITVTLTSSIDSETVTLAESTITAGDFDCTFGGCIVRTAEAASASVVGVLEAVAGDTITLTYTDLRRADGNTSVAVTDSATANATSCEALAINEVVTQAQQDWSSNGFTSAPGGTGTADDQWIEIKNVGTCSIDLTGLVAGGGFQLSLLDATPYTYEFGLTLDGQVLVFTTGSTATAFKAGDYLVIGLPSGASNSMANDLWVRLDAPISTGVMDQVALGASVGGDGDAGSNAPSGASTDTSDEAVRRDPDGTGAFGKGAATIGSANP
jgi:hypothetical protein